MQFLEEEYSIKRRVINGGPSHCRHSLWMNGDFTRRDKRRFIPKGMAEQTAGACVPFRLPLLRCSPAPRSWPGQEPMAGPGGASVCPGPAGGFAYAPLLARPPPAAWWELRPSYCRRMRSPEGLGTRLRSRSPGSQEPGGWLSVFLRALALDGLAKTSSTNHSTSRRGNRGPDGGCDLPKVTWPVW